MHKIIKFMKIRFTLKFLGARIQLLRYQHDKDVEVEFIGEEQQAIKIMKLFLAKHLQDHEEFSAEIMKVTDSIQVENVAYIKPWKGYSSSMHMVNGGDIWWRNVKKF